MTSIVLDKKLGQGTYGSVYKIKDKDLAIKYITSNQTDDKNKIIAFTGLNELGELNYLKMFNHPNILKCESFIVEPKRLGIVIPLAYGDMQTVYKNCGNIINDVVITEWFYQIISAVHFLHKNNFYHCDIKPENILFIKDRAVLGDLGLVGRKEIDTDTVCQTITSPQLLYKREFNLSKNIINKNIFTLLSNEYQDDIWALGITFYRMIPNIVDYLSFSEDELDKFIKDKNNLGGKKSNDEILTTYYLQSKLDLFITNPAKLLTDSHIPAKYTKLLLILLDPLPINRSINLISLLSLDLFKDRKSLIDGDLIVVENPRPVIFTPFEIIKFKDCLTTFINKFRKIITKLPVKNRHAVFLIQGCDLIYRTYMFVSDGKLNVDYYTTSICTIILKINNNYDESTTLNSEILRYEREIVVCTNAHLSRINISDYITVNKYNTFIDWLIKNPEMYEQYSLSKLTQIINDI